ncbi:MAG: ThiF family adenylyltransferase [bacterium]|nr:ThiF family adenylyltransferase [bacterium]
MKKNELPIAIPIIFSSFRKLPSGTRKIDIFDQAYRELFLVDHPKFKQELLGQPEAWKKFVRLYSDKGVWIYYPWRRLAVRVLSEQNYFRLRTNRNRYVITEKEQERYRHLKVGIAGLSVGSSIVSALVASGGPRILKLADFDVVEVGNLNRMRAILPDVGSSKVMVAARTVWELDPFAQLDLWGKGVSAENIRKFITGKPRLDLFIDEMDSLDIKVAARLVCQKEGIPVVMATDNGDGVIVDVERFDLEKERPIFHGSTGKWDTDRLSKLDYKQWLKLATKIVDPAFLTEEMQKSLPEIGRTLAGVPQLGTASAVAGAVVAVMVRRIANKLPLPSGRYILNLEERIVPNYNSIKSKRRRQRLAYQLNKFFGKD